jgi:hypothetical protein
VALIALITLQAQMRLNNASGGKPPFRTYKFSSITQGGHRR